MQVTEDSRTEAKRIISYYFKGTLRNYPGDDNLDAYIELVMEFVSDWGSMDWLLKKSAGSRIFFPTPIELRKIYCSKYPPEDGFDTAYEEE